MKLHRADVKPDWLNVPVKNRSSIQKLAFVTSGVITPGNIATIIGFVMVLIGLWLIAEQDYLTGLCLLAVGRSFDVLDGYLAELTATKSPLGEKLDAGFDKLGTFLTLVVFGVHQLAPWWVLVALALPHAVISLIILRALSQRIVIHPSRIGKLSMATAWVGLVGLVAAKVVDAGSVGLLGPAAFTMLAASIMLGCYAAFGYAWGRD